MTTYYLDPAGSDSNNGLSRGSGGAWLTLAHAGATVAAGDIVKILGVAGNAASHPTTSLDYSFIGFFTPANGSTAAGYVRWVADETGPMPTIGSNGLIFYNPSFNKFDGLYLTTSGSNVAVGVIFGTQNVVKGCVLNLNNQAGFPGLTMNGGAVLDTEIYGGTASPAASSGSFGVVAGNYNVLVKGCHIHHCRDGGISIVSTNVGLRAVGNLIHHNAGNGISSDTTDSAVTSDILDNTIDANTGHGISLTGTAGISCFNVVDNLITNHSGSGKYGLSVTDGVTALNDLRKRLCDYNCYYGNTANYQNISAGDHDLALDPAYNNVSGLDYTPTNPSVKAAVPATFRGANC